MIVRLLHKIGLTNLSDADIDKYYEVRRRPFRFISSRLRNASIGFTLYLIAGVVASLLVVFTTGLVKGTAWLVDITLSPVQYWTFGIALAAAVVVLIGTFQRRNEEQQASEIAGLFAVFSILILPLVVAIAIAIGTNLPPIQYVPLVIALTGLVIFVAIILDSPTGRLEPSGCFPADTLVDTPNGKVKIVNISPGTVVWAWDVTAEKKRVSCVTSRKTYYENGIVDILTHSNVSTLSTTSDHTFVTQRGWVKCSKLQVGDSLLRVSETGTKAFDKIVSVCKTRRREAVYNLHTTADHNFICNGFVAHNFTMCRRIRTLIHRMFIDRGFIGTSLTRVRWNVGRKPLWAFGRMIER